MIRQNISFVDLGLLDYKTTLEKQKEFWQKRINDEISDTLILVEHQPVFTIGKHGKIENLLIPKLLLQQKNIPIYHIERGGDITFHGPGQLVGYPIFKFNQPIIGIKTFIIKIEQIICNTLKYFSINAIKRNSYIGVWVDNKKIASIGIAVKNRVTFHGFALNVSTDLSYFDWINPCGMKNIQMTSMEKILNKKVMMESVKNAIKKEFLDKFIGDKIKVELT